MTLAEWVEEQGRGALAQLQRTTDLAYTTVFYAKEGRPVSWATAKLISDATDGAVSIEQLCDPGDDAEATAPTPEAA